jgi:AraC-like DNA-binding protein
MLTNINLTLLCGGFHRCTTQWNKSADNLDQCYKFYFPFRGEAEIEIDGCNHEIEKDSAYFISGFHINRQRCEDFMDLYWVHFMPDSLRLQLALSHFPPIYRWDLKDLAFPGNVHLQISELFDNNPSPQLSLPRERPDHLACRLHALMLFLIGDLLEKYPLVIEGADCETILKLEKAILFMDANCTNNPSLREVAARASLSPEHFHRVFQKTYGISPFKYMLNKRLNTAKQLLATRRMTVKEAASKTGFKSEFNFSRVFKKTFGKSPSIFRAEAGQM